MDTILLQQIKTLLEYILAGVIGCFVGGGCLALVIAYRLMELETTNEAKKEAIG